MVGTVLARRFLIESRLGSGGMSTVYRATDEFLGRQVAVKVFRRDAADGDDLRREREEIRTIAALSHPAIVTLFDAVDDAIDGEPDAFLVMQLVEGEDLGQRLTRGPLDAEAVAHIGVAAADALAYVHERGIIHRDIKPGNILLPATDATTPVAMLTDFGIARIVDGTRLTATGSVLGTAAYLSPEQAGGVGLSGASDVYSLGLVLLECLTGERSFPGPAIEAVVARLTLDPAIPETLDPGWRELLRRMTARDPADRPSAREATSELIALTEQPALPATRVLPVGPTPEADGSPIPAPTTETAVMPPAVHPEPAPIATARSRRPARRRTVVLAGAGLAVIAAAAVTLGAWLGAPQPVAPVDYPAVDGDLGVHLDRLQESVEP